MKLKFNFNKRNRYKNICSINLLIMYLNVENNGKYL